MPGVEPVRPFGELRETGLLWLINATVFHPRGFALAVVLDSSGDAVGWQLLGDGGEPYEYADQMNELFEAAEETLAAAKLRER